MLSCYFCGNTKHCDYYYHLDFLSSYCLCDDCIQELILKEDEYFSALEKENTNIAAGAFC